jgi:hypothetical protein
MVPLVHAEIDDTDYQTGQEQSVALKAITCSSALFLTGSASGA